MLTKEISNHNFKAFLWHAVFLAFAKNFMDVDTVIPAMVVEAGGGAIHIGILTAIMLGGSSFSQLFFAPYLSNSPFKRKILLGAINARVSALFGLSALFLLFSGRQQENLLWMVFFFITVFSLAGAFANISYNDIFGKSVNQEERKTFFSLVQIIGGIVVLIGAFLAKQVLVWKEFPANYALMFLFGAGLLLIATAGFWSLKEIVPSTLKISGVRAFARVMKTELKRNKRLGYFLGYVNTQGVAISFLPFVMLYAKETFATESSDTGFFLICKVIGMVSVSLVVFIGAQRVKYRWLLYSGFLISMCLVFLALVVDSAFGLKYIFVIGGVAFSLYSISMKGVLLEISGTENRALYTGFAGAGNILPALFPLLGGTIISHFGFQTLFVLYLPIIASAAYFICRIDCRK